MRRIISSVLCVSLMLSLCFSANAQDVRVSRDETYVMDITDGKFYTLLSDERNVAIQTNDVSCLIDVSIRYAEYQNEVYTWTISDWLFDEADYNNVFWKEIIDYCENRRSEATIVHINRTTHKEPINITQTRGSATADLELQLEDEVGSSEYFGNLLHTTTYYSQVCRVYEDLSFYVYKHDTVSVEEGALAVGSFIVTVLGKRATDLRVKAVCKALGVAISIATKLSPGSKMNVYICDAMYTRYVTINGSNYNYNATQKFMEYEGYENAAPNNSDRAQLDTESLLLTYTDGASYYIDFDAQVEDAYDAFELLGQRD